MPCGALKLLGERITHRCLKSGTRSFDLNEYLSGFIEALDASQFSVHIQSSLTDSAKCFYGSNRALGKILQSRLTLENNLLNRHSVYTVSDTAYPIARVHVLYLDKLIKKGSFGNSNPPGWKREAPQ